MNADLSSGGLAVAGHGSHGSENVCMGYDLKNERGEESRFSSSGWALALNIAERHGWNPQGTLEPAGWDEQEEWGGDYDTMDGQRVSKEDAAGMVKALEKALADVHFAAKTRATFDELQDEMAEAISSYKRIEYSLEEAEEFGGRLRELIAFARGTSFVIE
jgi:hypothetical protein